MKLENFAKRDRIRFHTLLDLRYEMTPDPLRHVLVEIRRQQLPHAKLHPDPARLRASRQPAEQPTSARIDWSAWCGVNCSAF